ncbi:hypothetical protein FRC14_007755 [Serendipita sp. 396]|nr:hypothetical protein FRC14_007755 [Serendipita sp. 396]
MFASPSGVVRPLPPSPPQGDDAEHLNLNETTFDGPPRLPPMDSFHDQSHGPQSNGTPPLPGPSSRPASPPQSPAIQGGNSRPRNPLTDLIDSEEQFVSLMSAIIRVRPFFHLSNITVTHVCLVDGLLTVYNRKSHPPGRDRTFHLQSWIECSEPSKPSSKPVALFSHNSKKLGPTHPLPKLLATY